MSRRLRVALLVLLWFTAAGLCALSSLWAPFGHFLDVEQWPLGALAGWTARSALEARRRARKAASPPARAG